MSGRRDKITSQDLNFQQYSVILTETNTLFLVFVCDVNQKKFTSVPVNVVDINFHFDEQLLMSQDKTSYNLQVEGK